MFSRLATIFTVLFFAMFVTASAIARTDPAGSCNTGSIQCCNSSVGTSTSVANTLAGLLGIVLNPVDLLIGITCSPLSIVGVGGNSCTSQTVCCTGNNFNGLVVFGCNPINVNL